MLRNVLQKIVKLGRRNIVRQPRPQIHWSEVIQILALGTDAFGTYQVALVFYHSDGSHIKFGVEHQGYDEVIESLPKRFPSIDPAWRDKMIENGLETETVLYSREGANSKMFQGL